MKALKMEEKDAILTVGNEVVCTRLCLDVDAASVR